MAELKIKIGADVQQAIQGMGQVQAAANKTGQALNSGIKTGANQAGQSLNDFGRILQDLPFGFVGIQNNIGPLSESFRRLKAETGSTKAAFSSLAGSIVGSGGFGLALSAITAIVTFATIGFGAWEKIIGGGAKKAKEAASETDKYAASLQSIGNSISQEATRVSVLVAALNSDTLARKQKSAAIEELKRISPDYFGQLTQEGDLINGLTQAYGRYINSLKVAFASKAIEQQLQTLFDKKLSLEVDLDKNTRNIRLPKELEQQLTKVTGEFEKLGGIKAFSALDPIKVLNGALTDTEKKLVATQKALSDLQNVTFIDNNAAGRRKELDELNTQIDGLIRRRADFENFDIKFDKDKKLPAAKKDIDELSLRIQALQSLAANGGILKIEEIELAELQIDLNLRDGIKNGLNQTEIERANIFLQTELEKKLKANVNLVNVINLKDQLPKINTDFAAAGRSLGDNMNQGLKEGLGGALETMSEFEKKAGELVRQLQVDVFASLGEVIGNAINGGQDGLKGAFNNIIKLMAEFGKSFGKMLIEQGIAAAAAKQLIKNPYLSIAAGIALIAISTALQNSIATPFAAGGIVTGPTLGLVGEAGPEVIFPLDKLNQFVKGVGGGGGVVLQGNLAVGYDKLYFKLEEEKKKHGRM